MRAHALLLALLAGLQPVRAQSSPTPEGQPPPLRGYVDWQAHPAMHVAFPWFRRTLGEEAQRRPHWRHMLRQALYPSQLLASEVRLMGAAAYVPEGTNDRAKAWRSVLAQLEWVERLVARYPDRLALARSPEEARRHLASGKQVLFHSIEGGHLILDGPEDAAFWARRGVALITLVHLRDDEHGEAAVGPGLTGVLVNPCGALRRLVQPGRRGGLTARGKAAILELARAGIMLDLTHMSPASVEDALAVCRAHGIPPVVTHGSFSLVRDTERAFTPEQVLEVYRLGGAFALPLSGQACDPIRPSIPVPPRLARGTLHAFGFHHRALQELLHGRAAEVLGPGARLDDAARTRLAVGWASDWNGFVNHSRPDPDRPKAARTLELDRIGLAHSGLLPQHWRRLGEAGYDLDPLQRSLEQVLQVWERARRARPE